MTEVPQEMRVTPYLKEALIDDIHPTIEGLGHRRRGANGSPDGDPSDNGTPGDGRYPSRCGLPGSGLPGGGPPGGGLPGPPGDPGPPG